MKFLFDLGGVFFDWNPRYFYSSIFSSEDKMEYFLTEICNDEMNLKADSGILIKDLKNELIIKFPTFEKEIIMYYDNHRKMIKKLFQESIEILLDLKNNNYQCYVLSNWSAETFIGMENEYPFLKKFDGKIISGQDKLIKPNQEIYELAISRFNLIPQETVFIDDKIENIEAAKKMNFKFIHLINPSIIKREIYKFIV